MAFITVLGSSGCKYDYGNDTASFLINNKVIVDTGWNLVENLLDLKLHPADFNIILFTHFHHDHYLALPQFLFYYINAGKSLSELKLIGPPEINKIVKLAVDFLQVPRFFDNAGSPECIEINSGENITLEEENLFIEASQSIHPVDGRYYKITDKISGAKIGFAGDTAYNPDESIFFKDCGLLIHECSLGGKNLGENLYQHSSAEEAAIVAESAGVKKLALVHCADKVRTECLNAAKNKFSGEIFMPVKGDIIHID